MEAGWTGVERTPRCTRSSDSGCCGGFVASRTDVTTKCAVPSYADASTGESGSVQAAFGGSRWAGSAAGHGTHDVGGVTPGSRY